MGVLTRKLTDNREKTYSYTVLDKALIQGLPKEAVVNLALAIDNLLTGFSTDGSLCRKPDPLLREIHT